MAASLLSDAATFALRVSFTYALQRHAPAFFLHGPAAAPARDRLLHAAVGVLVETVVAVLLHLAFGPAMQQQVPAFVDTVSGLLVDTAVVDLHIAFGRAVQQQVPAFSIHGPAAAPGSNVVLDAAVRVLADTVSGGGVIVDLHVAFERAVQHHVPAFSIHSLTAAAAPASNSVIVDLHIAFGRAAQQDVPAFSIHGHAAAPASNNILDAAGDPLTVVVVLAVLLLILFTSCSAIALYLDRARAYRGGEPRHTVLVVVPFFHLAVAVVVLAVVGGEE
jgi:hypothetical protein